MTEDVLRPAGWNMQKVRRHAPTLCAVCIGVAISLLGYVSVRDLQDAKATADLDLLASHLVSSITKSIQTKILLLESIHSFYDGSHKVERGEFKQFVAPFLAKMCDIRAIEWVPRVPGADRAEWEDVARREGVENFRITERTSTGNVIPAAPRDIYYPVFFLEPYLGNEADLGFDLASNPIAREALDRSRDTGQPAASQRMVLEQETQDAYGFLIAVPVYVKNKPVDTVENRRTNLQGFVVGSVRIADLIQAALIKGMPLRLDVTLYDESAPAGQRVLWFHPSRARTGDTDPMADRDEAIQLGFEELASLKVGGRIWSILCTPTPEFFGIHYVLLDWCVLAGGLAFTALIAGLFQSNIRRAAAQRAAEAASLAKSEILADMGREIVERKRAENELRKLTIAVEQNPASIVVTDREGRIEYANPKFTRLTGYTLDEVRGKTSRILKSGHTPPEEYERLWRTILSGREWRGEFHNQKKDGSFYWEAAVIAPMTDAEGIVSHFVAVKEDITARKRLEEDVRKAWTSAQHENAKLAAMISGMEEGVVFADAGNVIVEINDFMCRFVGVQRSDILGRLSARAATLVNRIPVS